MVVEGAGTTSYTYDNAGRMTQLANWNSETTSWTFANANRTTRLAPKSAPCEPVEQGEDQ